MSRELTPDQIAAARGNLALQLLGLRDVEIEALKGEIAGLKRLLAELEAKKES